ncbi:MAG: hypothetical protein Q8K71_07295 [Polaromonas sp.]|nr:hypothetical protein [Polaromonas sp.]MDP3750371.1 hypothetical protein [Polaromonas sp.]
MSTEIATQGRTQAKHYPVRKEIVWLVAAAALAYAGYAAWDYWAHLNWPPHDGSNKVVVKSLECDWDKYMLYHKDISEIKTIGGGSGAVDRRLFSEQPQCAAALYLSSEGTGVRLTTRVYDRQKKRRTATIVTTFDKYED